MKTVDKKLKVAAVGLGKMGLQHASLLKTRSDVEANALRFERAHLIVAGHQPNYLPWIGFFDKMIHSDVFILEDDCQFEIQGFTSRNRIKTDSGVRWLSVPIEHVRHPMPINEVRIAQHAESNWAKRHWLTLMHNYCKAPFWNDYSDFFERTYNQEWIRLIDLNLHLISEVRKVLEINTPLIMASSLGISVKKSDAVMEKCKALGATTLFAGVGGKGYLDVKEFEKEKIKVVFQDLVHPKYEQLHGEFVPNLSIVDYLFCVGGKRWCV